MHFHHKLSFHRAFLTLARYRKTDFLTVNLHFLFSEESNKKHPFPCPTTYRTALLHYVDITSKAKGNVLQGLIEYARDSKEKEFLEKLTKNDDEGKVLVGQQLVNTLNCYNLLACNSVTTYGPLHVYTCALS